MTTERVVRPVYNPTPPNPHFRAFPTKSPHFIPTFQLRATLVALPLPDGSRTFRCRWEGMPPVRARKRQRVGQGEAVANAVPLAGGPFEGRAKPATGPGSVSCLTGGGGSPARACGGHGRRKPGRVRAGTCAQSISCGPSRLRPGQPGRRALKRGRWISQLRVFARPAPVGWGRHPATSGPRAVSATPIHTTSPEALPARGPPDPTSLHTPAVLPRGLVGGWKTVPDLITVRRNPAPASRCRAAPGRRA